MDDSVCMGGEKMERSGGEGWIINLTRQLHSLLIVRLYCSMGSAVAPDTAGPMTNPVPNAEVTIAMPRAWLLSLDDSSRTALAVPTIPVRERIRLELVCYKYHVLQYL